MYRKTYVEINLDNIYQNVKNIIQKYNSYQYYIGMVKANAYGHGMYVVNTLVEAGINYLAVSSLDEALEIRKYHKEIPILCTELIDIDLVEEALNNHVTLTIDDIQYLKSIGNKKCKVHIKLNTGMNRMGVNTKEEFNEIYQYIKEHESIELEGIYTHFATPGIHDVYFDRQVEKFQEITSDIDLKEIPIIHLSSSFILLAHPKIEFANAVRVGTILYGYDISLKEYGKGIKSQIKKMRDNYLIKKYHISPVIRGEKIDLKPAFQLKTNVMEIRNVKKGELLGYGTSVIPFDTKIAVLPIGYDEGIGRKILGRYVLINGKKYDTIGQVEMCMMFVKIDDDVKQYDEVTILGGKITLGQISRLKGESIQETLVSLGKNITRVYIRNGNIEKMI